MNKERSALPLSFKDLIKTIALILLLSFGMEELGFAQLGELSGLPKARGLDPSSLHIPLDFVTVKEIHKGSSGKLIIHLQDAHANTSGQLNLAAALDGLMASHKISLVLVEGSSGDVTLDEAKKIIPKKTWQKAAKRFLLDGILSGEEYLNLTTDHPMRLRGIEREALYSQNLEAYVSLADKRQDILDYIDLIQKSLKRVKNRLYPKALLEYESVIASEAKQSKGNSLSLLFDLSQKIGIDLKTSYPHLFKLKKLFLRQSKRPKASQSYLKKLSQINFQEVLREREALEDEIYLSRLTTRDSRLTHVLDIYLALLQKAHSIRLTSEEFGALEASQPDFKTQSWQAFLNQKLIDLGYFEDLVPYKPLFEEAVSDLKEFYSLVSRRDQAFIDNASRIMEEENQNTAFLITGGYHTQHLTQLLKEQNISYVVLTPVIKQETNYQKYEKVLFAGHQTPKIKVKAAKNINYLKTRNFLKNFPKAYPPGSAVPILSSAEANDLYQLAAQRPRVGDSEGARLAAEGENFLRAEPSEEDWKGLRRELESYLYANDQDFLTDKEFEILKRIRFLGETYGPEVDMNVVKYLFSRESQHGKLLILNFLNGGKTDSNIILSRGLDVSAPVFLEALGKGYNRFAYSLDYEDHFAQGGIPRFFVKVAQYPINSTQVDRNPLSTKDEYMNYKIFSQHYPENSDLPFSKIYHAKLIGRYWTQLGERIPGKDLQKTYGELAVIKRESGDLSPENLGFVRLVVYELGRTIGSLYAKTGALWGDIKPSNVQVVDPKFWPSSNFLVKNIDYEWAYVSTPQDRQRLIGSVEGIAEDFKGIEALDTGKKYQRPVSRYVSKLSSTLREMFKETVYGFSLFHLPEYGVQPEHMGNIFLGGFLHELIRPDDSNLKEIKQKLKEIFRIDLSNEQWSSLKELHSQRAKIDFNQLADFAKDFKDQSNLKGGDWFSSYAGARLTSSAPTITELREKLGNLRGKYFKSVSADLWDRFVKEIFNNLYLGNEERRHILSQLAAAGEGVVFDDEKFKTLFDTLTRYKNSTVLQKSSLPAHSRPSVFYGARLVIDGISSQAQPETFSAFTEKDTKEVVSELLKKRRGRDPSVTPLEEGSFKKAFVVSYKGPEGLETKEVLKPFIQTDTIRKFLFKEPSLNYSEQLGEKFAASTEVHKIILEDGRKILAETQPYGTPVDTFFYPEKDILNQNPALAELLMKKFVLFLNEMVITEKWWIEDANLSNFLLLPDPETPGNVRFVLSDFDAVARMDVSKKSIGNSGLFFTDEDFKEEILHFLFNVTYEFSKKSKKSKNPKTGKIENAQMELFKKVLGEMHQEVPLASFLNAIFKTEENQAILVLRNWYDKKTDYTIFGSPASSKEDNQKNANETLKALKDISGFELNERFAALAKEERRPSDSATGSFKIDGARLAKEQVRGERREGRGETLSLFARFNIIQGFGGFVEGAAGRVYQKFFVSEEGQGILNQMARARLLGVFFLYVPTLAEKIAVPVVFSGEMEEISVGGLGLGVTGRQQPKKLLESLLSLAGATDWTIPVKHVLYLEPLVNNASDEEKIVFFKTLAQVKASLKGRGKDYLFFADLEKYSSFLAKHDIDLASDTIFPEGIITREIRDLNQMDRVQEGTGATFYQILDNANFLNIAAVLLLDSFIARVNIESINDKTIQDLQAILRRLTGDDSLALDRSSVEALKKFDPAKKTFYKTTAVKAIKTALEHFQDYLRMVARIDWGA
jgi:hypothetical protein